MMIRLQVTLDEKEATALATISAEALRDPRDQIRFLLRQYLAERGILPQEANKPLPQEAAQ